MPNETSANLTVAPYQIVILPLDELFVPSWNPRKYIDPIAQANLRAFIERGGRTQRIEVLKADKGYWVISGQRRLLAFRQLKRTHIEAEIKDITLAEAKIMAETSNEGVEPYWLDSYENWETLLGENPDWSLRGLAEKLGKPKSLVHRASQIMELLNPASRALIRQDQEAQKALFLETSVPGGDTDDENKGKLWEFTKESARNLIPLLTGRSVEQAQAMAEKTVKTILKDHLNNAKVRELVAKANGGVTKAAKSASPSAEVAFAHESAPSQKAHQHTPSHSAPLHTAKPTSTGGLSEGAASSSKGTGTTTPLASTESLSEGAASSSRGTGTTTPLASTESLSEGAASSSRGTGTTTPLASTGGLSEGAASSSSGTGTTTPLASTGGLSEGESLFWGEVAGITVMSRIRAKVKKGERPTFLETLLLTGHTLWRAFVWVCHHTWRLGKPIVKALWKSFKFSIKEMLKILGPQVARVVKFIFGLLIFCGLLWLCIYIYHHGVLKPMEQFGSKIWSAVISSTENKTAEPVSTPPPTPSADKALGQPSLVARHDASQQVSRQPHLAAASASEIKTILPMQAYVESQSSVEDQKYLEMEIATLPHYSRVKDFPFTPLPMNADMASRRLADIQDSDKYKVFWGSDQQSVISITPTASNCTLMFKGGLEGLLGSTGKMEIYWEDVKCIHCSEIAAGLGKDAHTYFQFSLVVPAIKKPLTVQCDSAVELGHLISSLEFWLKTSRGTTAPLVGFPYLNQGLWLKGDNEVGALWANSPADKAGLQLGDFFWSVGKNTLDPQHHAAFEKALQSPQNTFFVVSPVDWKKAQAPPINAPSNYFNPKRRKVTLTP